MPETLTTTISGMPAPLLREIDRAAKKEKRSRSAFIAMEMERVMRERRAQNRAQRAA